MIAFLRGKIISEGPDSVIVDVRGVGYRVFVTPTTKASISKGDGEEISVETYTAVRENSFDIYGFSSGEERDFFEMLLSVSGIGPKSALSILSLATVETLKTAIRMDDTSYLTKVSGIGPKSAKKIVLELQDKISKTTLGESSSHKDGDVLDALRSLGYSLSEAREAVKRIPDDLKDTGERVKSALSKLTK